MTAAVFAHGRRERVQSSSDEPYSSLRLRGSIKANSGWDTREPNRVLANPIAGNNAEWRPGAGKVWLAGAKHQRAEVETIFVDETEIAEAPCQCGSRHVDFTVDILLQSASKRGDVVRDECSVRADRFQGARNDPFRLRPPYRGEVAVVRVPFGSILVPVPHDLVHPSTVQAAGQSANVI